MNDKIIIVTAKELELASSFTREIHEVAQSAHTAIDKLIVLDTYLRGLKREGRANVDLLNRIQEIRDQTYGLVNHIRGIHNLILDKLPAKGDEQ
jgi:hypothetical protein